MSEDQAIDALLVLPHLRIQSANAISSPSTWGFPSMTAFVGLMHALQRRIPADLPLHFHGVGVVCHHFEAQATRNSYVHSFHLTRNPVDKDGSTAAIVEQGRIHLDVTLVFGVSGAASTVASVEQRNHAAALIADLVAGMRVAGGSVLPPRVAVAGGAQAWMATLGSDPEERIRQFRRHSRRWLPGFALVSRDDLLAQHLGELRQQSGDCSQLDAWLDVCRLKHRAQRKTTTDSKTQVEANTVEWELARAKGWIVPIPVGYGALSQEYAPGSVSGARNEDVPFRFVESLYSLGQWISPHRLKTARDLLWRVQSDPKRGLYRCVNSFAKAKAPFIPLED